MSDEKIWFLALEPPLRAEWISQVARTTEGSQENRVARLKGLHAVASLREMFPAGRLVVLNLVDNAGDGYDIAVRVVQVQSANGEVLFNSDTDEMDLTIEDYLTGAYEGGWLRVPNFAEGREYGPWDFLLDLFTGEVS